MAKVIKSIISETLAETPEKFARIWLDLRSCRDRFCSNCMFRCMGRCTHSEYTGKVIDILVNKTKEQEADIIAMSRFLESHGWDSDSICGKLS